jgi:hypothetical protein
LEIYEVTATEQAGRSEVRGTLKASQAYFYEKTTAWKTKKKINLDVDVRKPVCEDGR